MTGLPISTGCKSDRYNSILIIINRLIEVVYSKLIKFTIDAPRLAQVIIDVIICHHEVPESIVTNRGLLFTSKFWFSSCYFLGMKKKLFTAFYPQIDSETEKKNSTMEAFLGIFVN